VGLVGLLVLAASALPTAGAGAQTEADQERVAGEIRSTRVLVGEASAEEARLLSLIDNSRRREGELARKLEAVDGQISATGRVLEDASAGLAAVSARQVAAQDSLDRLAVQLEESRRALTRQALTAYTGQSEAARYAGLLLGAGSVGEVVSKRSYLRWAIGNQTDVIASAERVREEVADRRDELSSARAEAEARRNSIAADQSRLAESRSEKESLRREVVEELSTRDRLRDEALARKREFEATLEQLERESKAIAEALRRRAEAAGPVPPGGVAPGRLSTPIPGAAVTSPFGPRTHPIYGDVRPHTGLDLSGGSGTPIRAAAAGVVVSAAELGAYGKTTVIDHGGGLATLYAHQSAITVSAGERVAGGQVIGRVGSTGASTGPHLHFEVRRDGTPVNPGSYL